MKNRCKCNEMMDGDANGRLKNETVASVALGAKSSGERRFLKLSACLAHSESREMIRAFEAGAD
jgi:hypothetical protein